MSGLWSGSVTVSRRTGHELRTDHGFYARRSSGSSSFNRDLEACAALAELSDLFGRSLAYFICDAG